MIFKDRNKASFFLKTMVALCLLGALTNVTCAQEKDEKRDMAFAKRAFQDGLYDLAEIKLARFIEDFPQSTQLYEVRWLLGQSYFFQEKYKQAVAQFSNQDSVPEDMLDQFIFWEAETMFHMEKLDSSAQRFNELMQNYPDSELVNKSILGLSKISIQQGKNQRALTLLKSLEKSDDRTARDLALLQKTRILVALEKWAEVRPILMQLSKSSVKAPALFEIKLWEGEVAMINEEYNQALTAFERITSDKRASPRHLVAQAWFNQGTVAEKVEQWEQASEAYEKCYSISKSPRLIKAAVLKYLEIEAQSGDLSSATLKVKEFVRNEAITPGSAWLAIARYHMQASNYSAAISELDHFITTFSDSPDVWLARLLLSEALLTDENDATALSELQLILENKQDENAASQARLTLANYWFEKNDFSQASQLYSEGGKMISDPKISEECFYRYLICLEHQYKINEFKKAAQTFTKKFPESNRFASIQLKEGHLLLQTGKVKEAREIFNAIIEKSTSLDKVAEATYSLGRSYLNSANYDKAAESLNQLIEDHPSFSKKAEVLYWKVFAEK
ncbi:MAG: tetratricopeptide repeat protein, partial [Verrucomicrobiota bacterium]